MTLAEIREVLLRELAACALGAGDLSEFPRDGLIRRVGLPLVLRSLRRGDQIRWRANLLYSSEERLVVERVEKDRVLFDEPRISVTMMDFCNAIANGEALDP